jgi:hypothetical protein
MTDDDDDDDDEKDAKRHWIRVTQSPDRSVCAAALGDLAGFVQDRTAWEARVVEPLVGAACVISRGRDVEVMTHAVRKAGLGEWLDILPGGTHLGTKLTVITVQPLPFNRNPFVVASGRVVLNGYTLCPVLD